MSTILSINTSTRGCMVTLQQGEAFETIHAETAIGQPQPLLGLVDQILKKAQCTLADLSAYAYTIGPGSFTGLRLAISLLQGFMLVYPHPVIPISTLACFAQKIHREKCVNSVLVLNNAHMEEVYQGIYVFEDGQPILKGSEQLISVHQLARPSAVIEAVTGDAMLAYPKIFESWNQQASYPSIYTNNTFDPIDLMSLAKQAYEEKKFSTKLIEPVYLRTASAWKKLTD